MKSLLIALAAVFAFSASARAQTAIGCRRRRALPQGVQEGRGTAEAQLKSEIDDKIRALSEEKRKIEALKDNDRPLHRGLEGVAGRS